MKTNKHIIAAVALAVFSPFAPAPITHADVEDSLGDVILAGLSGPLSESLHAQIDAAITAPDLQQVLADINLPFVELVGRELIGNGINVGDPIPGVPGESFTGTNDGLLTPYLDDVGINPGNLSDGGYLLGDNAPSNASTSAQELPPITCTSAIIAPTLSGVPVAGFGRPSFLPIIAPSVGACDGPAGIGLVSEISYDGIPIGIPGLGFGIGGADTTTATLGCFPGVYTATLASFFLNPPGYAPFVYSTPLIDTTMSDIIAC